MAWFHTECADALGHACVMCRTALLVPASSAAPAPPVAPKGAQRAARGDAREAGVVPRGRPSPWAIPRTRGVVGTEGGWDLFPGLARARAALRARFGPNVEGVLGVAALTAPFLAWVVVRADTASLATRDLGALAVLGVVCAVVIVAVRRAVSQRLRRRGAPRVPGRRVVPDKGTQEQDPGEVEDGLAGPPNAGGDGGPTLGAGEPGPPPDAPSGDVPDGGVSDGDGPARGAADRAPVSG